MSHSLSPYGPLSKGFSKQEYWSGLSFYTPGDLPKPGIKPASLTSPALAGGFFTTGASLVAQLVKNPPAMQETWIRSLGWRIPWSRERLPTLVFWPGEFHGLYSPWGRK